MSSSEDPDDLRRRLFEQMAAGQTPSQEDVQHVADVERQQVPASVASDYRSACSRIEDAILSGKRPDPDDCHLVSSIVRKYGIVCQSEQRHGGDS